MGYYRYHHAFILCDLACLWKSHMPDDIDLEYIRRHYDGLATEELIQLYVNNKVTDKAQPALLEELNKRGINASQLTVSDEKSVAKKEIRKQNKKVIAFIACAGIFVAYHLIGVIVFGWEHGGGVIPMLLLFVALRATWRAITK